MFVLTLDQRGSRSSSSDLVKVFLDALKERDLADLDGDVTKRNYISRAARYAGDEVQIVTSEPNKILPILSCATEIAIWRIGLGIGDATVDPQVLAASHGKAFERARSALEKAGQQRKNPFGLAVVGCEGGYTASLLEAVLQVMSDIFYNRSPLGWEAVNKMSSDMTLDKISILLDVARPTISQRLRVAKYDNELALGPFVAILAAEAEKEAMS
jgi:hypothetical protein